MFQHVLLWVYLTTCCKKLFQELFSLQFSHEESIGFADVQTFSMKSSG